MMVCIVATHFVNFTSRHCTMQAPNYSRVSDKTDSIKSIRYYHENVTKLKLKTFKNDEFMKRKNCYNLCNNSVTTSAILGFTSLAKILQPEI